MGSPVDVVPGEIIEAEWGNTIRDQTISRWPDATARDAGIPIPEIGKVVWLSTPGTLEVYDGAAWVTLDVVLEVLKLAGGTMTGPIEFAGNGRLRGASSGIAIDTATGAEVFLVGANVLRLSGNNGTAWMPHGEGTGPSETNPAYSFAGGTTNGMYLAGTNRIGFSVGGNRTAEFGASGTRAAFGIISTGAPQTRVELRLTDYLSVFANNTAGTSILEYLRLGMAGSTPRVSYRSSASTSTAVANATWFTSNEITSGSRSLGQAALAQADHIAPGTLADIDLQSDPAVSALAAVPIRRAAYKPGYLVAGDPREGVAHPMILADELEALAPEMVDRLPVFDDDGTPMPDDLVVNGAVMSAALLGYIRHLEERIAALEA